jgi:cyclophilin family peptidyl-prolyl cis-trans isomerase
MQFQPFQIRRLTILAWMIAAATSLPGGTLARFGTVFGEMEVELFDQDKPVTVQNFIRYVESGLYRDSIIHRCPVNPSTFQSDFVIQGGGVWITNRGSTNASFVSVPIFGEIQNEFGAGRRFSNVYGTIAMAKRGGETNSASSQWFFNLKDNTGLDTGDTNNLFVVFGRVLRGTNVLEMFKTFRLYVGGNATNVVVNIGSPLQELPLLAPSVTESNLLYVDVSLLKVNVALTNGAPEISWRSVIDRTNRVEFTTRYPPVWQTLTNQNGNGAVMRVIDSDALASTRFYRVRVDD